MADQPRMHLQETLKMKSKNMPKQSEIDTAAALRVELEIELKNKKQCSYQPYECTQLSLDGYKYCSKHILQDKNAPFKQCSFVYSSNGKRCHLPTPRGDKKDYGYCHEHALKTTLARNKQNSKYPPPNTAEVLLQSLSHYIKKPRNRSVHVPDDGGRTTPDETVETKVAKTLDPFVDLDATSIYNKQCNDVLDFCSESESDVEASTFATVWHDAHADSSDNESVDSEQEDVLKHANVYTAEEITRVTRDKLIRLQSLYIEQYRHLQHTLKEKRRKYLHALKREKETCCNIYNQVRDNPKEQRLYKKLKHYNNYQREYGVDAILNKRLHDLRAKISDGAPPKGHNYSKCLFTEGGVKCGERTLPLAKHCRKHILEDPNQVLFRACGKINGDIECNTPIEAIFEDSMCRLHMDIPPLRCYNQTRKDSESDLDDSAEACSHFPLQFNENIKTELLDYSLAQDIPKMETVPSMLFEESQSFVTDDLSQDNSSIHSQILFNGTSNCDDEKMDSNDLTSQIPNNLEQMPVADGNGVSTNMDVSNITMEITNNNMVEEADNTEVSEAAKQDEINKSENIESVDGESKVEKNILDQVEPDVVQMNTVEEVTENVANGSSNNKSESTQE